MSKISEITVTGVTATTNVTKPPVGSKVPVVVYNGAGTCSGTIYLEDGSPIVFQAPLALDEARDLTSLLLRVASRVYSDVKGGMPGNGTKAD